MVEFPLPKVILNIVILILTGIPILIFKTAVTPYQRGYYCDDESIRYPYKGSTVSTGLLIGLGISIPVVTICVFEAIRLMLEGNSSTPRIPLTDYFVANKKVHRYLVRLYIFLGFFFFGAAFSQVLTDIGKYSIGRLRPHFVTVCKPSPTPAQCNHQHISVGEFKCSGDSEYLNTESRLSFPSGHASFSFYTMIYLVLYIEARVYWTLYSPLLRPLIQFIFVALAAACAYSRISDYKHHWSDVFAGALLGTTVAVLVAIRVGNLFRRRELPLLEGERRQKDIVLSDLEIQKEGGSAIAPIARNEDLPGSANI